MYEIEWYSIVDILAKEYGWTIEYISNLQTIEIRELIKEINKRKVNEYNTLCYIINCALTGKQPQLGKHSKNSLPQTEEEALISLMKKVGGKVEKGKK